MRDAVGLRWNGRNYKSEEPKAPPAGRKKRWAGGGVSYESHQVEPPPQNPSMAVLGMDFGGNPAEHRGSLNQ